MDFIVYKYIYNNDRTYEHIYIYQLIWVNYNISLT